MAVTLHGLDPVLVYFDNQGTHQPEVCGRMKEDPHGFQHLRHRFAR